MEEIYKNIFKINVDSNIYFLKQESVIIDTGPPQYKAQVSKELSKITDISKIKTVILTHLHYDHMGNFDLFTNAEFFASEEEIEFFKKNRSGTILDPGLARDFNVHLNPLDFIKGFQIIKTPGHTIGSFCLLHTKSKILFSGDTLFNNGYGRLDLPSSVPDKMDASLKKLQDLDYSLLAPGHDY